MFPEPRSPNESERLRRVLAVVPAAGFSRRMGTHKLLLDVAGQSVLARLVQALRAGGVAEAHLLVREEDVSLREAAAALAIQCHLAAAPTEDMRASVQMLLDCVAGTSVMRPEDAWLLCPADHPVLSVDVVSRLIDVSRASPTAIHVPTHAGRRGHPALFPWRLAAAVAAIPNGQGLNWLVRHSGAAVLDVPVDDDSIHCDLDTPEEYQLLLERLRQTPFGR